MTPSAGPTDAATRLASAQEATEAGRPDLIREHVLAGLAVVDPEAEEETELRLRLTGVGWTLEERGPRAARSELDELRARAVRYPQVSALCLAQSAVIYLRSGELTTAAGVLDEVDDAVLGPLDRVRVLLNRGTLAAHLEPGAGEPDLWRAHEVAAANGMAESAFRALHNLGWSAFLRGDLPEALTLMRRADQLDVEVDRTVALLDLARVQLEAGLVREAHAALLTAAAGAAAAGQQHTAGEIDLELARTQQLLGDRDAAAESCRNAWERFRTIGSEAWAGRARLREIVVAGTPEAIEELDGLITAARDQGDFAACVSGTLTQCRLALERGEVERAEAAMASLGSLGTGRAAYLATRLAVLDLRTRLALAGGDRPRAARALRRAAIELGRARVRPASLDLRTAMAVHARGLADLDLQLAAATGRPGSLFGAAERWRGSGDLLPTVLPPRDREAADLTRHLRALREEVRLAPPGADSRSLMARIRRLEPAGAGS